MKKCLSILLFIITAWYIMPVSNMFLCKDEIALKCSTENSSEETEDVNKEKSKEFISSFNNAVAIINPNTPQQYTAVIYIPVVHHTVETPPPNLV
jgi:hypothetical protein